MSVELVNDHVLLPMRANYADAPVADRRWQNTLEDAEFGNESRFALRSVPRRSVRWRVTPSDIQQNARLLDQIIAARKSGLACAPFFGRGSEIAVEVTGTTLEIEPTLWEWNEGDYLILIDEAGGYDVRQVETVVGETITLDSAVSRAYGCGLFVWPLIFGRFDCDSLSALRAEIGEASLSVQELTSGEAETVGVAGPPIDGIGGWIIEDTFIVQ